MICSVVKGLCLFRFGAVGSTLTGIEDRVLVSSASRYEVSVLPYGTPVDIFLGIVLITSCLDNKIVLCAPAFQSHSFERPPPTNKHG